MRLRTVPVILLILLIASVCALATNGVQEIPVFPQPYGFGGVFVSMGWYNCTQAWYFCTATNDIRFTGTRGTGRELTLAPKLSSALVPKVPGGDIAARPVYVVTNFQNPWVFSAAPGQAAYSALWQVFNVTWKRGVTPRPICNAEPASVGNPQGLPDPTEADITATNAVLDCPILAIGPLATAGSGCGLSYRIPQAGGFNTQLKFLFMPAWLVYCQDPVTKRIDTAFALITDVADPALASVLGANLAPGLLNMPDSDTTDFFVMRGPKPLTQLPVVEDCPSNAGAFNRNYNYSPVMRYVILQRNVSPLSTIKSVDVLKRLLTTGGLQVLKDDQRINASVLLPG